MNSNVSNPNLSNSLEPASSIPEHIQAIVDVLDDKRALDIAVMDLRQVSQSLDYFIIASGSSSLQLNAMEDGVKEKLRTQARLPKSVEGPSTRWVLMDYGDTVVHIMSPEARDFYDLEGLWADAERLEVQPR